MVNEKHYVPILKGKMGEYGALQVLSAKAKGRLTPLIEIPEIPWDHENDAPARTIDDHLKNVSAQLGKSWGGNQPFYIDLVYIPPAERMKDGRHPLTFVLDEVRSKGPKAVPVTGLGRDADYQSAVEAVVRKDSRGACVRLTDEDFEETSDLAADLQALLKQIGLREGEVEILIDLEAFGQNQVNAITSFARTAIISLPSATKWRGLILAGTSFPENLKEFPPNSASATPRAEWALWMGLVTSKKRRLPRVPTFSDYAIQHPDLADIDPRVMQVSANLRYALELEWLILRGRTIRKHSLAQFHTLCQTLVGLGAYKGKDHCAGCEYIDQVAKNQDGPGNLTTWRKVGTVHHLTMTTEQIASFPFP